MPAPTRVYAADAAIASSNFVGVENPLSENGAWLPTFGMSQDGVQFQKNNGAAYAGSFNGAHNNHPTARTTASVPTDQYSEIVVGHIGSNKDYVGPSVRIQTGGPALDSQYTYWASLAGGENLELYRFDCCTSDPKPYLAQRLAENTPVVDNDRLRLIARGPVIYGLKNGKRDFIYNTGKDAVRYDTGTTGMMAFTATSTLTDATIASWSTGPAPTSSGTWASTTFDGTEDPLDEEDRWYPLALSGSPAPGTRQFSFKKAGGVAISNSPYEQSVVLGAWSIAPPATQYSEVTLGPVDPSSSGGGAVVRIDRTSFGPTGWQLFVWADAARNGSGIYKLNPVGEATLVRPFNPTVATGDKWRLTADGNTLEVFRNGVSQFTYTTDGSYPTGDVGIQAYSAKFPLDAWEGGALASPPPPATPTINGFAPTSGAIGTTVQVNGTGFDGATAVTFNGASASFTVTSATVIQASVPSGATTGPISVTTPGGTAASANAFTVTATPPSPPAITDFAPTSGPVGTSVQIDGTDFDGASSVTFSGVSATFTVASAAMIQATVPSGATTGLISVTTPGGAATSANAFTVTATPPSPPTITDFAPTSGPVGTSVQINGTDFDGASSVTFNGSSAAFTVASAAMIQATVPSGATTGLISVTTPGGTAASANTFTVTASPPTITSFAPTSGPVGTSVQINGTNFSGTSQVKFNGVSSTFTVTSSTTIRATVPAGATTGAISVTTPGGTTNSASSFTVTASPPTITSFTPARGPVGTSVQINGTNFGAASSVTFNGASASFTVTSSTTIRATVPAGATTGAIAVTTPGGTATSASSFTVTVRLSVTKTSPLGVGRGTVTSTSSPGSATQINCGASCSVEFAYGTVVTLTATPELLSLFDGWTDCDSSSGTTCTVTMNSARTVTARFLP